MLVAAGGAAAVECNFSRPVGTCTGTISVLKTSGSKPSYAAEIRVSSSASACSKVEYYINSTPHQTVLKNASSDTESVSGTNPITRSDFRVSRCTTYETSGAGSGENASTDGGGQKCMSDTRAASVENMVRNELQRMREKAAQAENNKRTMLARANPDRDYLAKVDKFLADMREPLRKQEAFLNKMQNCRPTRSCFCH